MNTPGASRDDLELLTDGVLRLSEAAWALNPLLQVARARMPLLVDRAVRLVGPPPTLFIGGDLPLFTTSGHDPENLVLLPWVVRHRAAAAEEPTRRHLQRYAAACYLDEARTQHSNDLPNLDYRQRFLTWLTEGATR